MSFRQIQQACTTLTLANQLVPPLSDVPSYDMTSLEATPSCEGEEMIVRPAFFPRPTKAEVESHPVKAWSAGRAQQIAHRCFLASALMSMYQLRFFVPVRKKILAGISKLKWHAKTATSVSGDLMTTSRTRVIPRTFKGCWKVY